MVKFIAISVIYRSSGIQGNTRHSQSRRMNPKGMTHQWQNMKLMVGYNIIALVNCEINDSHDNNH